MVKRIPFLLLGLSLAALAGAAPPTVETFKQALTARLQKLRPEGYSERQVLFQSAIAGTPRGSTYPFQATVVIRDYGTGYPKNRFYGATCVGRLDDTRFTLEVDDFGGWDVQGTMTPPIHQCKDNPAEGVSSFPLASLTGSAAPAGNPQAPAPAAKSAPAQAQAGGAGAVAAGSYECWANGEARGGMNFTIRNASQYTDSEQGSGTYSFNAGTQRITFKGGGLDGILPAGFYGMYHLPNGTPTVSFRNSGGMEVTFCERVR